MNDNHRTLTILLAIPYGLAGITWLYLGIITIQKLFTKPDSMTAIMLILFITLGAMVTTIACLAIFKPTNHAIRSMCSLIGFTVIGIMMHLLRPATEILRGTKDNATLVVQFAIPLLLGVITYKYLVALLTGTIKGGTQLASPEGRGDSPRRRGL